MFAIWCVTLERIALWNLHPLGDSLLTESGAGNHTMRAGGRDTLLQPPTCAISVLSLRYSRPNWKTPVNRRTNLVT